MPRGIDRRFVELVQPFDIDSFSTFFRGLLLMILHLLGLGSAVAVNEETEDPTRTPPAGPLSSRPSCWS
jgi:hypothetical protein